MKLRTKWKKMLKSKIFRIDGIKWWITWITKTSTGGRRPVPLCPVHDLRMTPVRPYKGFFENATSLKCAEGPHSIKIPRNFGDEKRYVLNRIDAKIFKNMEVINLDDEAVPIAESKVRSEDNKHFVISRLMESKRGLQLVLYAGEKGKHEKTQIFVEPEMRRMDFDRNNLHPSDVFLEVKAKYKDGSSHKIKKGKKNEN